MNQRLSRTLRFVPLYLYLPHIIALYHIFYWKCMITKCDFYRESTTKQPVRIEGKTVRWDYTFIDMTTKYLPMQHFTIELDLSTSKPIPATLHNDVRNAAVIYLYKHGTLSMLEAAQLIGCNRRDFEEILVPKYGIPWCWGFLPAPNLVWSLQSMESPGHLGKGTGSAEPAASNSTTMDWKSIGCF